MTMLHRRVQSIHDLPNQEQCGGERGNKSSRNSVASPLHRPEMTFCLHRARLIDSNENNRTTPPFHLHTLPQRGQVVVLKLTSREQVDVITLMNDRVGVAAKWPDLHRVMDIIN